MARTSDLAGIGTAKKRARALTVSVVGVAAATLGLGIVASNPPAIEIAGGQQQCVNGIVPLNPYVVNCNLPSRGNQVVGAAPDAGASSAAGTTLPAWPCTSTTRELCSSPAINPDQSPLSLCLRGC